MTIYTPAVTKRLVDIDDDLLEAARRSLGTKGIKDTVHAALTSVSDAEVDRDHEIREAFAVLAWMDLGDADREAAWR